MSNFGRNLALWVIIALLLVVLFNLFQPGATHTAATQVAYSDFINEVNGGRVRDVVIQGRTVSGQLTDGRTVRALYVVGKNFKFRLDVDLGFRRQQQCLVHLVAVGLLRGARNLDAPLEHALGASGKYILHRLP